MTRSTPATIILGAHRSGTSLVSRALEAIGLFVGRSLDENHEATFFLELNTWILRQAGGAWDYPAPVTALLSNARLRTLTVEYLRVSLSSPRARRYWGWRHWLTNPANTARPWGWKDPRNSFTLPFWLDVLGRARVIHVRRHGVDVAASLWRRATTRLARAERRHRHRMLVRYRVLAKRRGFTDSVRCLDLADAFGLWEEYEAAAQQHLSDPRVSELSLSYEDVLLNPRETIRRLADFCGLPEPGTMPRVLDAELDPRRAFAYRRNAALADFGRTVGERLERFGYHA